LILSDANLFPLIRWTADGLVPAIVQDAETSAVLMMAWMDREALSRTIATGQTHFYSRSRRKAWHKGETSGHVQHVESLWLDCDADVILIKARQIGGACHEGYHSCFFRRVDAEGRTEIVGERVFQPESVYGAAAGTAGPPAHGQRPPTASPE
jgi:phosphoribosyl-AMP cyclohydrolase